MTLRVYDSSGLLLRTVAAGNAAAALGEVDAAPQPFDPGKGLLTLSQGGWSYGYDGKDNSGAVLRNGVYLLSVESVGPSTGKASVQIQVVGSGGMGVALVVAPNPARPGVDLVRLYWSPLIRVELKVYALDGELIRDLGLSGLPPQDWDLRGASGQPVANGIYVVNARVPGERSPRSFKLMVAR